ncbi:GAF domain-containing sensor histidine kinase [uncultured Jatrophihabitans sp.]|uniref:GAF domain-containing sensor histidine kinase n=1 Tax=uncultured Jatrophihabitans sp. TaxID=1610747 RepID=UPI0035C94440
MSSVFDDKPSAEAAMRRALNDSPQAGADRPLPELLTDVARDLHGTVACQWVAIVVWASDGPPELLVTAGDDAAARTEIDGPQSAADLLEDAAPAPPDGGPVTRLTVPLLLRGRTAGVVDMGGISPDADLAEADSVVHAAAANAGAIVERARTADANRRREKWLSGGTDIARALTAEHHPDPPAMIAERAAEIASADNVLLLSPGALPGLFRVDAAAGATEITAGQQLPDTEDGHLGRVLAEGRAVRIDDVAVATPQDHLAVGASLLVPMFGSTGLRGVMCFGRLGRNTFSEAELGMATLFAGTVALALELAESQSRREQVALILERDRIARDLHDHVIQRLYAIGLTVQHVSSLAGGETADRLFNAVTDIDAAIAQIRSTIFRLTTPILGADRSLRALADALIDELEPVLGYRPALLSEGPLDFGLDDDLITDCEAVLREGITNIARHAQATRADVKIAVGRDQVQIEISDNGRGLGDTDRRSGLANMRQRAEQHGGAFELADAPGSGTRLVWTVPLGE